MNEISCAVAGDLLPLYAENMLSDESRRAVEEHLAGCEVCREKYERMTAALPIPVEEHIQSAEPLKKFRFHLLLVILGFPIWFPLLAAFTVVLLVIFLCIWVVDICVLCIPISLGVVTLGGIVALTAAILHALYGNVLIYLGCILVCGGISVLTFFLFLKFTQWITSFTRFLFQKFKMMFSGNPISKRRKSSYASADREHLGKMGIFFKNLAEKINKRSAK